MMDGSIVSGIRQFVDSFSRLQRSIVTLSFSTICNIIHQLIPLIPKKHYKYTYLASAFTAISQPNILSPPYSLSSSHYIALSLSHYSLSTAVNPRDTPSSSPKTSAAITQLKLRTHLA